MDVTPQAIALSRFGLGARPDETPPTDPKAWIEAQFARFEPRPAALSAIEPSRVIAADIAQYQMEIRDARQQAKAQGATTPAATPVMNAAGAPAMATSPDQLRTPTPQQMVRRDARRVVNGRYADAVDARLAAALVTPAPFVERMVHFWANHFALSADKITVTPLAGAYEFEAIRPHVLGRFSDMLTATSHHPAMLLYLDQAVSIGPDSPLGQRAALNGNKRGLNENLGREILELHTLGVGSGYSQADVTEFARALTGWTVAGLGGRAGRAQQQAQTGDFVFVPFVHEPGDRTILGKSYAAGGEAQAQAVLDDLARHPATAKHVATKLARHFAGDQPPQAMIDRLTAAFQQSNGDLPTVYRAIIASPEAWASEPTKFRTPWEWAVASYRAVGQRTVAPGSTAGLMTQLGQPIWKPGQPNGFDDLAASWAGPDAVMRRVEAAERLAARTGEVDARALGPKLYPGALTPATAQSLQRAESPGQALALLLVAPESMRR